MTPKEKAIEIHNKMYKNIDMDWVIAKYCALTAVDEIKTALSAFGYSGTFYDHEETRRITLTEDESPINYWEQVKEEIEKL